ncbi:MAG: transporter substrate-binding domain-containing protein [Desulfobacteraceae bacterium]|nr:transporter substrate-binding domain-containing protein [Desulfobacteraceae bacterium]
MLKNIAKFTIFIFVLFGMTGCFEKTSTESSFDGFKSIRETNTIRIAIAGVDYPPFVIDTSSDFVGFDIDLAYDIAKRMGVKAKLVKMEFDEIIPAIKRGDADIGVATFTITAKLNMEVLFSNPYIVSGQALLVKNSLKNSIFSYRDLNSTQYKIAYEQGTTSEAALKKLMPDSRFFSVDSSEKLSDALVNGEADAVMADLSFCSILMAKNKGQNFYFIDEPLTFEPFGIAINNENYHLLNWINNYIQQIQADGSYDEFYKKWFQDTDWIKYLKK